MTCSALEDTGVDDVWDRVGAHRDAPRRRRPRRQARPPAARLHLGAGPRRARPAAAPLGRRPGDPRPRSAPPCWPASCPPPWPPTGSSRRTTTALTSPTYWSGHPARSGTAQPMRSGHRERPWWRSHHRSRRKHMRTTRTRRRDGGARARRHGRGARARRRGRRAQARSRSPRPRRPAQRGGRRRRHGVRHPELRRPAQQGPAGQEAQDRLRQQGRQRGRRGLGLPRQARLHRDRQRRRGQPGQVVGQVDHAVAARSSTIANIRAYENKAEPRQVDHATASATSAPSARRQWPTEQFGPPTYTGVKDSHPYATLPDRRGHRRTSPTPA